MIKFDKNSMFLILISLALLSSSGCAVLAIGAGAAGGYAISKDEVEGFSDKSYDKIWNAGWKVITEKGLIEIADKERGKIEAVVEEAKVEYRIEQVSPKSIRIVVQARKAMNLFPDIELAQDLYNEISRNIR